MPYDAQKPARGDATMVTLLQVLVIVSALVFVGALAELWRRTEP